MVVIVYLLLALGLFVPEAYAQMDCSLSIRMFDEDMEPIPKAEVRIDPLGMMLISNTEGFCRSDLLSPGRYYLQATGNRYAKLDTVIELTGVASRRIELVLLPLSAQLEEVVIFSNPADHYREFSKNEILESGCTTLESFLHQRVGMDIVSDGGSGEKVTARIGGSNPNQVIVLLDGRRIQSASDGVGDLSSIPLDWIETVEIHRGSQTLLGGEGIGGIIDIRTRRLSKDEELCASVDVTANRQVSTVSRAGEIGELESFISFSRTQGNGAYRYRISEDDGNQQFTNELGNEESRENNDLLRDQFFAKAAYRVSTASRLEISGASDRSDRGIPGYLSPRLTPLARQTSGSHFLNANFDSKIRATIWKANASLTRNYRHFSDPDPYSIVHESRESDVRYTGSIEGYGSLKATEFTGGIQAASETFSSEQIAKGKATQDRWESWLNAERVLIGESVSSNVRAQAGWRVERVGSAEAIGLPKLQVEANMNRFVEGTIVVGWGRSYRAPSFYSLFWQEDQVARGNPDLKPEYSEEWTGSFFVRPSFTRNLEFGGSVSSQRVEDLIYWQQTFDGHWKPMNLKRAEIQTLELQLEYSIFSDHVRLLTGTTWTEARDATNDRNTGGKYLTFRPARTHRASCLIDWMKLHLNSTYQWVDERPVLATNSKWLSEYSLLDFSISRQFRYQNIGIRPGLRVTNALNESYRIIRHAPMPLQEFAGTIHFDYSPAGLR